MKSYDVIGIYKNRKICRAHIDNNFENGIKVELWSKKINFNKIPLGKSHYDIFTLNYNNYQDYLSMLFNKRDGSTARGYLKKLNMKIIKKVI